MMRESVHHVRVQLFDHFELSIDDQRLTQFSYDKVKALMIYLLLNDQAVGRAVLAELLWPDQKAASGRTNLRHALHSLRQSLGDEAEHVLMVSRQTLALQDIRHWTLDTCELDAQLAGPANVEALEQVLTLYKGELVGELQLPQCPDFQRWLLQTRSVWRQRVLRFAERVLESEPAPAVTLLRSLVGRFSSYSPFQERLVRQLAEDGQIAAAHEQFNAHLQQLALSGQQPSSAFLRLARYWSDGEDSRRPAAYTESTHRPALDSSPLSEDEVDYRQLSVMVMRLTLIDEDHDRRWERDCLNLQRDLMHWLERQCHHLGGFWLPGVAGGLGMACFGTHGPAHQLAELVALYEHCRLALPAELAGKWRGETAPPRCELAAGLHSGRVLYIPSRQLIDPQGRVTQPALELMNAASGSELVISLVASQHMPPALDLQPRLAMRILAANGEVRLRALVLSGEERKGASAPRLIGRESEIRQLSDALARVTIGLRQSVLIRGEPGMGKSALMVYFRQLEQSQDVDLCWLPTTRLSYQEPFSLIRAVLRWRLNGQLNEVLLEELINQNAEASQWNEKTRALMFQLLGLRYLDGDVSHQSGEAIDLMVKVLQLFVDARTRSHVLIIMIDDLQWLDEPSLKALAGLQARLPINQRLLLIASHPGREVSLPTKFHWDDQIVLGRLDTEHVTRLLNYLMRRYRLQLNARLRTQLIERCDGVPLYLHEICRRLDMDRREGRAVQLEKLPCELFGLLSSRIDQLDQHREVAHVAAVIGRQFRSSILRDCLGIDDEALKQALERMQRLEIIEPCVDVVEFDYQFTHQLLQEAAYLSCPEDVRGRIHNHLVELIEQGFPTWLARHPGYFAMHLCKSGHFARAARYYELAARDALRVSANRLVLKMAESGLDSLRQIGGQVEREVSLLIVKGQAGFALEGHGSSIALESFQQASQLLSGSRDIDGDDEDLELRFLVQWGLWVGCSERHALVDARAMALQLHRLAEHFDDVRYCRLAQYASAYCDYWSGCLTSAFERFAELDPLHSSMTFEWLPYSEHPQICACVYQAWVWCLKADYERAEHLAEAAIRMAEKVNHPGTLALVLIRVANMYRQLGQLQLAGARARRALELTRTPDLHIWHLSAQGICAWESALAGNQKALATLEELLEQFTEVTGRNHHRRPMLWYIDACLALGQLEKARLYLEHSLTPARERESLYLPELLLLSAKTSYLQDRADPHIRKTLDEALREARHQENTHLELLILEAWYEWLPDMDHELARCFFTKLGQLAPSDAPVPARLKNRLLSWQSGYQ